MNRPTRLLRGLQWLALTAILVLLARDFGGNLEVAQPLIPLSVLVFILASLQAVHGGMRSLQPECSPAHLLPLPFLVLAVAQSFGAGDQSWLTDLQVSVWLLAYVVYWVLLNWVRNARDARIIWVTLVAVVCGSGASALYQYFFDARVFSERLFIPAESGLASGFLADPAGMAFLVGMTLPFLLTGAWMRRFLMPLRILCGLLAVAALIVLWASASEVGLAMLLATILFTPFFAARKRLRAVISILWLVLIPVVVFSALQLFGGPASQRLVEMLGLNWPTVHLLGPLSNTLSLLLWVATAALAWFSWRFWRSLPYAKPHPDRDHRKRRPRGDRQPSPLNKLLLGALLATLLIIFVGAWFYDFTRLPLTVFAVFTCIALIAALTPQIKLRIPRGFVCACWLSLPVAVAGWQMLWIPAVAQAQYHVFVAEQGLIRLADDRDRVFDEPNALRDVQWHAARARELRPERSDAARIEADALWSFRHTGRASPSDLAEEVLQVAGAALDRNPEDGRAHWLMADAMAYLDEDLETVEPHLLAAQKGLPESADAFALHGWLIYRASGDARAGRQWVDAALEREPQHREALLYQSLLLLEE
ncbi:MAG: oligosaccharide repeat unit polymerase [Opitutales bacterium]|nr:oligosaccharide repeat unit polymerase [Opitutales bacterium]